MRKTIAKLVLIFMLALSLSIPAAASAYGPMDVLASEPGYIGLGLLIGAVLAIIVCLVLKSKLKNVRLGTRADNYVSGRLNLTNRTDRFTHRTTTRTKIEKK